MGVTARVVVWHLFVVCVATGALTPLCGNGRIDTEEDYLAYYTNRSDEWVSVPFRDGVMDLSFVVGRERCDGMLLKLLV
jgi:hypothetical protein